MPEDACSITPAELRRILVRGPVLLYNEAMMSPKIKESIEHELAMGYQARSLGLEARARVCARRAVGIALRAFFEKHPSKASPLSVVDMIRLYQERPELSPDLRAICSHLLIRVTPDYELPIPADLLAEAKLLIDSVLENDNRMTEQPEIILYGTSWCGDTRRTRAFLDRNHIPYRWIDIDQDAEAEKFVKSVNHGFRSVPTLIFPDGSQLTEPGNQQLAEKLGLPSVSIS